MRPKSIALLLLALGCGLVASIGITELIARRNVEPIESAGETPVFVAMNDIALGDQLTSQVVRLEHWPKEKALVGAVSRIEDIEGRRARSKLYAGEPILENKLLSKGASGQGATALIPKGYRVVPVKVDLVSGGSSMILPGDRVDVMVHLVRDPGRDIHETVTRTILQDIKVFAVDDMVDLEKDKDIRKSVAAKTISLLVTPEQAARVMLASQMGIINLVMRSSEDDQQAPNVQAKPSELLGVAAKGERGRETLMEPSESDLGGKTKSLLGFLNTMKGKPADAGQTQTVEQRKPPEKWTMRMLKPGSVDEVTLERESDTPAQTSPAGAWKPIAMPDRSAPVKSEPTLNAPSAPEPPTLPTPPPAEPPPLKPDSKEGNVDTA